jgi:2-phosphosulfolactate phosphatase
MKLTNLYLLQSCFRIRCEWGVQAVEQLGPLADAIVIVDVLSFSTCVEIAVGRDASVLPFPWKDDSVEVYAKKQGAIVAGPRSFSGISLSPNSLLALNPGQKIVLPSPNGSALSFAAQELGKTVIAGCLRNAAAIAQAVEGFRSVLVVPAGERWPDGSMRPCIEDIVGAGAIISYLGGICSPEAEMAKSVFRDCEPRLRERLSDCVSGRELIEKGFEGDVELACDFNASEVVPKLVGEAFSG